jgi:hypothetical protein
VIQLSPQIQSTEHLTESPDAREALSAGPAKAGKKDGPGAFAKLLAGLLQKSNKTGAESAIPGDRASVPSGEASVPLGETSGSLREPEGKAARAGRTRDGGDADRPGGKGRVSLLKGGDAAEGPAEAEKSAKKDKGRANGRSLGGGEEALAAAAAAIAAPEIAEPAAPVRPAAGDGAEEEAGGPAREISPSGVPNGAPSAVADGVLTGGEPAEALPALSALPEKAAAAPVAESGGTDRGRSVRDEERGTGAGERPVDVPATLPAAAAVAKGRVVSEKDGRTGAAAEVRGRDRRKERLGAETGEARPGSGRQDGPAAEGVRTASTAEASPDRGRETEITVELRAMGKTQGEISMEREDRPVQGFQDMLARELHENLNGDIVRHASVMLRDGGEGTIRLSLRPESLGSVKIRLEIAENKIAGRIIVESDAAFKAFEQELHSLEQSFRESGFDGANLEMAFSSDGGREGRRGEADSPYSGRLSASRYDAAVPGLSEEPEAGLWLGMRLDNQGRPQINMLV